MNKLLFVLAFCPLFIQAQNLGAYDVSDEFPYGRLNPEAPPETGDYASLIGTCDCKSTNRNPDGSWAASQDMVWSFKYILNGYGVQDQSAKQDGSNSGSVRQFIADSSRWYVHWYSNKTPSTTLPTWEGNKKGDDIVLYKPQKAPNGMEGNTRLTFSNISENGFNWVLEWVNPDESIVYPTWKIACTKREE